MKSHSEESSICAAMRNHSDALFHDICEKVFQAYPEIEEKFGNEGEDLTREYVQYHIDYLTSAVCLGEKHIFLDYIGWLKIYFTSIQLPKEYILPPLRFLRQSVAGMLEPLEAAYVNGFIDYALERYNELPVKENSYISSKMKLNVLAHQYLSALLRMDKAAAEALIVEKVRKGTPVRDVYLHVFQPVQWEVGRRWQENEISVGMEHYITAATQGIMARLYEFIFNPTGNGRSMVATNVSGDLHDLGIRMVADFFEMEGWNTYYLGANTPQESILRMIRETNAELLAISATLPLNLPRVKRLISYIRKEIPSRELRIIVGGKSFNAAQKLWRKVGADGYASNAEMALREINRLSRLN